MDSDELDFLSPDFDPEAVTIPRLRSILLEQGVHYPSTAKKAQLVDLFNRNVAPNTKRLRKARDKTEPTTKGIEDQDVNGVDEKHVMQSVEPTPRRSGRKPTPRKTDTSAATSRRSSAGMSSRATTEDRSRASASVSERDSVERHLKANRRRTRYSDITPMIKEEDESATELAVVNDESPFSSDNPFQSGSSPLIPPPQATTKDSRRTHAVSREESVPKPRQAARKTGSAAEVRARRKIPSPSPTPVPTEPTDEEEEYDEDPSEGDAMETGEEFTQEEQEELEVEKALTGKRDVLPARQKKNSRRGGAGTLRAAPWAILAAALGGLAVVWRQEKLNVGYCGVGRPSSSIGGVEIPDWARFLQPQCEPCPPHAYCHGQLETTCEPDFVLEQHPLALGGSVPLPPTCQPDSEKERKKKAYANRILGLLRDKNAKHACGGKDETGRKIQSPEITEQDLKKKASAMRRRDMSQSEFDELWSGILDELMSKDEVVSGSDGLLAVVTDSSKAEPSARTLSQESHSPAPSDDQSDSRWRDIFGSLSGYGRDSEIKAKQLASFALDRLAARAAQHTQSPTRFPEAYISMGQLRDDVLRDEFSARTRQKLWHKVQAKVENNSNVRSMVREGRTGEVSRVWEWIGAVPATTESASEPLSSPPMPESNARDRLEGTPVKDSREMREARRWEEGRPVY